MASATDGAKSYLAVLGSFGAPTIQDDGAMFRSAATALAQSRATTLALASRQGGDLRVLAHVGPGPEDGAALTGGRVAVIDRALSMHDMATGLLVEGGQRRLVLAIRGLGQADVVAFQESPIAPEVALPEGDGSPLRELRAAVFASPRPDPRAAVITTEGSPNVSGRTVTVPLVVGADRWTLVAAARHPLVGRLATRSPWMLLFAGLLATALAAGAVQAQARREEFAQAAVAERTADLEVAQRGAETANRSKNEFLSRMSHELRTPLNSVLGFGQLLEMEPLTEDQRDSVHQIMRAGRHLLDLINEVLDISRIESGNLALSLEPVKPAELIDEVLTLMTPAAEQFAITLTVGDLGPANVYMRADRQRAKQILLNLVSNALKYNRPGGSVTVTGGADAGHVRIDVIDTGLGVRPEDIDRLFSPFDRLDAEVTGVEGTGIGLSVSRRLADAMGGALDARSDLGVGTTLSLTLPRTEPPVELTTAVPAGDDDASGSVITKRATVLYIEDNTANVELVTRILARRPAISLVSAARADDGLGLAREKQPDVVLLDLHLPDATGEDVLCSLRRDPRTTSIPVIVLTADATPGTATRLRQYGATEFFTKPLDVPRLLNVLDTVLR